ncbi:MAG TPA: response regulator [Algoriphagus sp.]|nr:response regulator [Algoriphagus sp.]
MEGSPGIKNISVARDGQEALDFLFKSDGFSEAPTPDLVLLDVNLPLVNGHDVLQKIKENTETRRIPVFMLTTSSSPEDVDKSYSRYANLYITQPVDMDSFEEAITTIKNFWSGMICLPKNLGE